MVFVEEVFQEAVVLVVGDHLYFLQIILDTLKGIVLTL
jgi:hypothetical protein